MTINNHKLRIIMTGAGMALFLAFIGFSYLVAKETFTQLDFDITVKLQDKIPRRFDYPFSWFSVLGSAEVTGIVWAVGLLLFIVKRFWKTAFAMFLLPLALAMEVFGKVFVKHPAPPFMFYRGVLDIEFPQYFVHDLFSYPSGHETRTAFLIVLAMGYFYFRRSMKSQIFIQPVLAIFLVVMTVSRIYLGEHWSTDVLGGFLVGAGFGLITAAFIPEKKPRKKSVTELVPEQ